MIEKVKPKKQTNKNWLKESTTFCLKPFCLHRLPLISISSLFFKYLTYIHLHPDDIKLSRCMELLLYLTNQWSLGGWDIWVISILPTPTLLF